MVGEGTKEMACKDLSTLVTQTRFTLLKMKICSGHRWPHTYLGPRVKPGLEPQCQDEVSRCGISFQSNTEQGVG